MGEDTSSPEASSRLFRLMVENLREYAVFSTDAAGRVTSWNAGAERFLGFTEREMLGEDASIVFTPEDRAAGVPEREMRTAAEKGRAEDRRWHVRKDGSRFWANGMLEAMRDPSGTLAGFCKIMRDETERRLMEERLSFANRRVVAILESITDAFFAVDRDWRFTYANQEAGAILERPSAELIGRTIWEEFPDAVGSRFEREYRRALAETAVVRFEAWYERLGRWFEVRAFPSAEGLSVFFRDVTARNRAVREADEQRRLVETIAHNASLGLLMTDARQRCTYMNPAAEAITGFTFEEVRARDAPLHEVIHHTRPDGSRYPIEACPIERALPTGSRERGEDVFVRKDGTFRPVAFAASPILDRGGAVGTVIEVRDISDERRAAREREELLARERDARRQAEAANLLKDEFLATVSHELRTPLNSMLGWTHMLSEGGLDARATRRAIETIDRNARSQAQLIEDLLDVSRIVAGKLRLEVRVADLPTIVAAAVDAARPSAEAKGVALESAIDRGAGAVSGDPERLQQVVWNLLSNAIKFTPRGGRVEVELRRPGAALELVVRDSGAGIGPELLPHVFERFWQADAATTRKHGGLGLGLSIVRHLVEIHGGSVRAESPGPGRGSAFTVALPQAVGAAEPAPRPRGGAPAPECAPELDGINVLAVDDEPDSLEVVERLLSMCGARVRTAGSAAEALRVMAGWRPDVLVSDIGMPDEDGYALIRRVRQLEAAGGGHVPAVALTAYARVEDRLRVLDAGFQMHVPKPVEPAELVTVVATLAGRGGTARGGR